MTSISTTLLNSFICDFAGYGSLQAPIWFLGMEEGSGQGIEELTRRVHAWSSRGCQPLEDLPSFHHAIELPRHFVRPWPLQRTWAPLLHMLLAWRGIEATTAELRRVQSTELGTHGGDSTLVELLPLPAPRISDWPYAELSSELPALANRETYRAALIPARILMLRELLARSAARAVVCYGLGYLDAWRALGDAHVESRTDGGQRWLWGQDSFRQFAFVPHPVARGTRPGFWTHVGRTLRDADPSTAIHARS